MTGESWVEDDEGDDTGEPEIVASNGATHDCQVGFPFPGRSAWWQLKSWQKVGTA